MNQIVDAPARFAAIDPMASFCISAPAGSGKTELLIQRYLSLLSRVQRPEQVLAITFTRKAAAEMRERVIATLKSARAGEDCPSPHHQTTRVLAERVLAVESKNDWNLGRDISRFNIKTIDSFSAGLTRQMPVLSQIGGQAVVQDDTTELYKEAVLELYALLDEEHPVAKDLAALMLHFDNNWERLQDLLVSMLACREQWREYVGVHYEPGASENYQVAAVEALVREELQQLGAILNPYRLELLQLLQFSAGNLDAPKPADFPGDASAELQIWSKLRTMLLTNSGGWRKSVTVKQGFPNSKGEPEKRKGQLKQLLSELKTIEGLDTRLNEVDRLPRIESGSDTWKLALNLSRVLPTLAAQLLLVFQRHGVVDHSQVAQSALLALGDDEAPTELALRLDYQIEHILVDEFQDTAITQYELLQKLTRGWGEYNAQSPDAPRTLMVVGDAMQSIYGFRGANVGLFLKARLEGFNGVELCHLELACNFRSDWTVVDWVNQTFSRAFPENDDACRAKIRYSAATAMHSSKDTGGVDIHGFYGDSARLGEIQFIGEKIAAFIAGGCGRIAVLGRSRSNLQPVISHLKALSVPYYAPDLDALDQSEVVADLMTLCRALANDADRLAWMSLLRAPWCGFQLPDLLVISRIAQVRPGTSIWSALQRPEVHSALSKDGRTRLQYLVPVLKRTMDKRDRLSLRAWIEQAWTGLDGPACVAEASDLSNADSFLQLLEVADAEGVGLDITWLALRLKKQFIDAGDPDSSVHLMTMHKAKGLEFECVIIPQLDRLPRSDNREILLWDEHSDASGARTFLLAADDHSPREAATLYNYLRWQRQEKTLLENTRLMYVGATRAISRLLLTARITIDEKSGLPKEPSRNSLLSPIWTSFKPQMTVQECNSVAAGNGRSSGQRKLARLQRVQLDPADVSTPLISSPSVGANLLHYDNHVERGIGTVVHLALEELSQRTELPESISTPDKNRWRTALQCQGVWGEPLNRAMQQVCNAVENSLAPRGKGRWVLSSEHLEARSEWPLTMVNDQGRIQDIVIDRCFVDRATGERWIIDYKNSQPVTGETVDAFLSRETVNHLEQLQCYREALQQLMGEPAECALYFPQLGHLHVIADMEFNTADAGDASD